ncbi:hypothetical protein RJ035_000187 [Blastomyces gilchristii]
MQIVRLHFQISGQEFSYSDSVAVSTKSSVIVVGMEDSSEYVNEATYALLTACQEERTEIMCLFGFNVETVKRLIELLGLEELIHLDLPNPMTLGIPRKSVKERSRPRAICVVTALFASLAITRLPLIAS